MATTTVQFSDLSRKSKEVAQLADQGPVTITRRDGESLLLVRESDAERSRHGQQVAAQIVGAAVSVWPKSFVESLRQPFPWIEFLGPKGRDAFAHEVFDVARACATFGTFERLDSTISSWQATAEAVALGIDPAGGDLEWLDEPQTVPNPGRHRH